MIIYLDIVFIENVLMNYIILFATAYILKLKKNHILMILSSILGSIYSIIAYMGIMEFYSNVIAKVILSIAMIYLAFLPKTFKTMLKQLFLFYLVSFVFGGCAFALLYIIKPQEILIRNGIFIGTYPLKIALLGGIVGFILLAVTFFFIKTKLCKKDIYCDIEIFFESKSIYLTALIDTGNMLKDPITNTPVIIVEKLMLKSILPSEIYSNLEKIFIGEFQKEIYEKDMEFYSKLRMIPFKSLGKENGMLIGFKINKMIIYMEENQKYINNAIVGIYNNRLSKNSKYTALIGLDLIEGGNEDEFVKDVSWKY